MIVAALTLLTVAMAMVAVFTVTGRAVLVLLDRGDRPLSTATLLGAATIITWLCAVALILPPGSVAAVASTGVGVAVLVGGAWRHGRTALLPSGDQWRIFAGALLAGAAALVPFLVLVASARSTAFVHLDTNHDGFFFTAAPRWLMDHRGSASPGIRADGSPRVSG